MVYVTKDILNQLGVDLVSGKSFSEGIRNHKAFTEYEYYSLKIGEETGTLTLVTKQLANFFLRKNNQRRDIISALTYPAIVFSTAFLVVLFMLSFVVPMFQDIFRQNKVELPGITKFIISISEFVKSYGVIIFILLFTPLIARSFFYKKQWYKRFKDRFLLKIPFLGNFIKTVYLSQFTQ